MGVREQQRELRREYTLSTDKWARFWDRSDMERYYLHDVRVIELHLNTGKAIECTLIEMGMYAIVVDAKGKRLLIPKHSIEYMVIGNAEEK